MIFSFFSKPTKMLWGQFQRQTDISPPSTKEKIGAYALYLLPLFFLVAMIASRNGFYFIEKGDLTYSVQNIISIIFGAAFFSIGFVIWEMKFRKKGVEKWFFTHLLWITQSYIFLVKMMGIILLLLVVCVFIVMLVPALLVVPLYGLPFLMAICGLIFIVRLLMGCGALYLRRPIGKLPSFMTEQE